MISQQLHRDRCEHRHQVIDNLRHNQDRLRLVGQTGRNLVGHSDYTSATRLDLFHVGCHLVHRIVVRRNHHNRQLFINQSDRPVLHFPGRITFGVDIGDLLQFQRALQGDRVLVAPPEVEKVVNMHQAVRDLLDLGIQLQALLDLAGQADQRIEHGATGLLVEIAAQASEVESKKVEGHQLRGKRLGRGHTDLGTGVGVDDPVAFPGNRRFDDVADRQDLAALAMRLAQGREGISCLTALADHQGQGFFCHQWVAIAKLAGNIDFNRNPGMLFQQELANQSRMPRGAAGNDIDPVQGAEKIIFETQVFEENLSLLFPDPSGNRIGNRPRLLMNLLEHEVPVAILFRHDRAPGDGLRRLLDRSPIERGNRHALRGKDHQLAIFEENHLLGVRQHGRNVGGDEVFALPLADHQGRPLFGGDQFIRFLVTEDCHGIGAAHFAKRQAHGGFKIAAHLVVFLNQVGDDLRIGIGAKSVALFAQAAFQIEVILDDAVVDDHETARVVRMGINFRRSSMGRPTGVADTGLADQRLCLEIVFQVDQLAFSTADIDFALAERRNPG